MSVTKGLYYEDDPSTIHKYGNLLWKEVISPMLNERLFTAESVSPGHPWQTYGLYCGFYFRWNS